MATAFEEKVAKLKELGIDTPQGILSLIESGVGERGLDTAAERDYIEGILGQIPKAFGVSQEAAKVIKDKFSGASKNLEEFYQPYTNQFPEGSERMFNEQYDSWSPSDLPNQMDSGLEGTQNLGLPNGLQTPAERDSSQTASYKAGYTSGGYNTNWGGGNYNYMKDVYDVQTIDAMINSGEIHPKTHVITPRSDIGEDQYHVKKLASTDNSFYNQQLGAFFPYNKESGFTGGRTGDDRFNQNPYNNTFNPYSGLSYPWQTPIPLDFNNFS